MAKQSGVGESLRRNGQLYDLFDYCFTKEEAEGETQELHKAGYLCYRTGIKSGGYHIWIRSKQNTEREK